VWTPLKQHISRNLDTFNLKAVQQHQSLKIPFYWAADVRPKTKIKIKIAIIT